MQATRATAKIYAQSFEGQIDDFIGIFHRWIQEKRTDDLLIDIHDYSHVHHGPGVILVAHECIYSMDADLGRLGLLYKRRRDAPQAPEAALSEAVRRTVHAARLLEEDTAGKLRFSPDELLVGFADRLHTPNDSDTFEAMRPELQALGEKLYGGAEIAHDGEPRGPFRARLAGHATSLEALSARL